jgi:hypothetical protein
VSLASFFCHLLPRFLDSFFTTRNPTLKLLSCRRAARVQVTEDIITTQFGAFSALPWTIKETMKTSSFEFVRCCSSLHQLHRPMYTTRECRGDHTLARPISCKSPSNSEFKIKWSCWPQPPLRGRYVPFHLSRWLIANRRCYGRPAGSGDTTSRRLQS